MDGSREQAMLRAAQLYYYENMTQAAIADRLKCTRWTVGRLLEEARASGMVTITINHPHARMRDLEEALCAAFSLREAVVMPQQSGASATAALVSAAAAEYLTGIRPKVKSLGIAWGRTMTSVARAMPEGWTVNLEVFQTYGGLVRSNDDEVADSIGLMARRGQGVGHMIPAPAIVTEVKLGQWLRREPSVARTLVQAPTADVLMFSPGILEPDSVLVRSGFLTERGMARLKAMGAVTDLFSHFVDAQGQIVSKELEMRTIAVPLHAVQEAKHSVAVGSGAAKALPLRVSLSAGYANVVITDATTAEMIVDPSLIPPHTSYVHMTAGIDDPMDATCE